MKKILFAIDGSEHSKKAIEYGKKIAETFNSDVELLTVVIDMKKLYLFDGADLIKEKYTEENFEDYGKKVIDQGLDIFKDFGGNINTTILYGDPGAEIIKFIERHNFDLVVMGSRGISGVDKLMVGSVSNRVLNHVGVPILIVK